MQIWSNLTLALAGLSGAAGVGLAALASHSGGGGTLMTAALFCLLHAAPMLAIAIAQPSRGLLAGASILALGTLLFSGDLALRTLAGVKPWAMAAPAGGSLLILGWLWLAVAGCLRRRAGKISR